MRMLAPGVSSAGLFSLLSFVEHASDGALLMSRKNCHAKNVSSIVLAVEDGRLFRAFLAWPGHRLADNRPDGFLEVGIHDHRYDLTLSLIHGDVCNVLYQPTDEGGHRLHKWRFSGGIESGEIVTTSLGMSSLTETSREHLGHGYCMLLADDFHDIECRGVCGWFVAEGERKKRGTTLFTNAAVSGEGLYQPFTSRSDVIEHVYDWVGEATR
jgi:hypothetical protein